MKFTEIAKTQESETHNGDVTCLLWHNGELLSTADDGVVKVWTPDLHPITEFKGHDYAICDMISNGGNILTSSNDFSIREWKKDAGGNWTLVKTMKDHEEAVRKIALYQNVLYSGDDKGEVRVWKDGEVQGMINVVEEVWDMCLAHDKLITVRDRDVVVSSLNPGHASVTIVNTLFGRGPVKVIGDNLVFMDRGGMTIQVHDAKAKGNPLKKQLDGHVMMVNAFGCDPGTQLLISGGWDEKIVAWDLKTMAKIGEQDVGGYVNVLAVNGNESKNSQYVFVGGGSGSITTFKIES